MNLVKPLVIALNDAEAYGVSAVKMNAEVNDPYESRKNPDQIKVSASFWRKQGSSNIAVFDFEAELIGDDLFLVYIPRYLKALRLKSALSKEAYELSIEDINSRYRIFRHIYTNKDGKKFKHEYKYQISVDRSDPFNPNILSEAWHRRNFESDFIEQTFEIIEDKLPTKTNREYMWLVHHMRRERTCLDGSK